ncbi:armadillo-type protein [Entophlyctis helioformis]|nr:armadillo-type protein [Entophlyctis helioformis]
MMHTATAIPSQSPPTPAPMPTPPGAKRTRQPSPFYSTAHLPHPPASQLIADARASLSRPTRPVTPAVPDRTGTLFWSVAGASRRKPTLRGIVQEPGCSLGLHGRDAALPTGSIGRDDAISKRDPHHRSQHRQGKEPAQTRSTKRHDLNGDDGDDDKSVSDSDKDGLQLSKGQPRSKADRGRAKQADQTRPPVASSTNGVHEDGPASTGQSHVRQGLSFTRKHHAKRLTQGSTDADQSGSHDRSVPGHSISQAVHPSSGGAPLSHEDRSEAGVGDDERHDHAPPAAEGAISRSRRTSQTTPPRPAIPAASHGDVSHGVCQTRAPESLADRLNELPTGEAPDTDPKWMAILEVLASSTSTKHGNVHIAELHAQLKDMHWLRQPADAAPTATDAQCKLRDKRRRETVIQALIKWMHDSGDAEAAISASSLILKLTHDNQLLLNACQLLFKLSKNEKHDGLFGCLFGLECLLDFVSAHVQSIPTFFGPRCHLLIFATGALKNATNNVANQQQLVQMGGIQRLGYAIRQLVEKADIRTRSDQDYVQAAQLLAQICGCLRNLASTAGCQTHFVAPVERGRSKQRLDHGQITDTSSAPTPPHTMPSTLDMLSALLIESNGLTDADELILAACRILSKLSLYKACLSRMGEQTHIAAYVALMVKYQQDKKTPQPVLTRLGFILGNLTVDGDTHRVFLRGSLPDLIALFGEYADSFAASLRGQSIDGGLIVDREHIDLLVKLVRLVANLSIDPECGKELVGMAEMEVLVDILGGIVERDTDEELLLNVTAALANVTFYLDSTHGLFTRSAETARYLLPLLMHDNPEIVLEACRASANMTRLRDVQGFDTAHVCQVMTILLDHADKAVVHQACGVLLNLGNRHKANSIRACVLSNEGHTKLIEVFIESVGLADWPMATIAAQALFKICASSKEAQRLVCDAVEDVLAETDAESGDSVFWGVCDAIIAEWDASTSSEEDDRG